MDAAIAERRVYYVWLSSNQLLHRTSIMSNPEDFVGVILAAGIGSRLRPITESLPKCMVKTAGKPLLEYQFDAYRNAGITELVVVVGYEGQAIRNYCKHIKDLSITIIENLSFCCRKARWRATSVQSLRFFSISIILITSAMKS